MNPVAFQIGPIAVRWYGLLIASALLIGITGGSKALKKRGVDEDDFLSVAMTAIICAFLGARVYYVLFNLPFYTAHPREIIAIWHGGLAIHGGIIGGGLAVYIMCRRYKINFWLMADAIVPFLALGQAIGRWGNFFNQEAYGRAVDPVQIPWAIFIEETGLYHHPTFLYESLWDLLVFALLIILGHQLFVKRGEVALSYLILYSCGRIFVEGLRTDSLMLGPLRMAQVISIIFILVSIVVLCYRRQKYGDYLPNVREDSAGL